MADPNDEVHARARARVGTLVRGKYRIERVLGVGGMAVVYAARHRNNATFAIKMLHPEMSMRSDIHERFIREGYIANSVGHPGAVAVVDDDVSEDGAAFIVMEMLRGAPVDALCDEHGGKLSLAATVAISCQLLDVLAAAHQHGIVHRDIKPANIFVTLDGGIKVLDFGIARLRDAANQNETSTGMVMGTPTHMAPEQARGQASQIGAETDVWAVGATMFSLLAGEPVHVGESPQHVCILAATAASRPIASVVRNIPSEIAQVIDGAIAFHKHERWPDAAMMRDALRAAYRATCGELNEKEALLELVRTHAARNPIASPSQGGANPPVAGASAPQVSPSDAGRDGSGPLANGGRPTNPATANDRPAGSTTAQPVSATGGGATRAVPAARRPTGLIAVAALLATVGVAWIASTAFRGQAALPAAATGEARQTPLEVPVAVPIASPTAAAVVVRPLDEPALVPPAPAPSEPPPPLVASRPADSPHATRPLAAVTARPVAAIPAVAPPPAPSTNTKPDCNPNYYYDADGVKHFKHGCY